MFRRRMLEKRNERDALDQLLVVVTPSSVLAVGALAGVLLVALGWSVLARIPVKVDGQGILLRPGFVRPLESGSDGRVTNLLVSAGDFVEAGQPVAQLSQPELD
ncbi:MAG: biotin/lipoyl-binding protein, partial [Pseudomonadota bacterium]